VNSSSSSSSSSLPAIPLSLPSSGKGASDSLPSDPVEFSRLVLPENWVSDSPDLLDESKC
jgi:hypothetical protein